MDDVMESMIRLAIQKYPLVADTYNLAMEEAARRVEVLSLLPEFDDNFNSDKPGCAAILADQIRLLSVDTPPPVQRTRT